MRWEKKSGEAFFGGVTGLGRKVTRNLVGEPFFFVWSERCNDKERGLRYDTVCDDDDGVFKNCLGECEEGCSGLRWSLEKLEC